MIQPSEKSVQATPPIFKKLMKISQRLAFGTVQKCICPSDQKIISNHSENLLRQIVINIGRLESQIVRRVNALLLVRWWLC